MEYRTGGSQLDFEEMARIVDEAREVEYSWRQAQLRQQQEEQRARAPAFVDLLRRHLPAEVMSEFEEFMSTGFGSQCLSDALFGGCGFLPWIE